MSLLLGDECLDSKNWCSIKRVPLSTAGSHLTPGLAQAAGSPDDNLVNGIPGCSHFCIISMGVV